MHAASRRVGLALLALSGLAAPAAAQVDFINAISIGGGLTDLAPGTTPNDNRLSLFSDLIYDRAAGNYLALPDRGPGGGVLPYQTRIHQFGLNVDPNTGVISSLALQKTTKFTDNSGANFNGLNPRLLNGDASVLGRSHDPEGLAKAPNGNFFVADEYGPSVYEFAPSGALVRAFTPPANILPRDAGGNLNFVDGRGTIVTGRQDNRGYEGLAISPDGSKLYAILQDPLVNEGSSNEGRRSRNLRIVEYSVATGQSTAQYIYQLEALADINGRIPGTTEDFGATAQGRNIGVSAIIAIGEGKFLVIERDNRGLGVDALVNFADGTAPPAVGSKRIYEIDLAGATDVSGVSLANSNSLPAGVTPVSKKLFLDVQAQLAAAGLSIPEKLEGLTVGPQLNDGSFVLLVGTDNDFSVTQTGSSNQFDAYYLLDSNGNLDEVRFTLLGDTSQSFARAVDANLTDPTLNLGALPGGFGLIPSNLYAFRVAPQLVGVPEPGGVALFAGAGAAGLLLLRRRKR